MDREIYIVLDIGTSSIKCGCLAPDTDVLTEKQEKFPMVQSGDSYEIDFTVLFDLVKGLVFQCLMEKNVQNKKVGALLVTSQANTFVPVDHDFEPLRNGIVWLDGRARNEADHLNEQLSGYAKYSGFGEALPGLFASKLLWLKRNEPTVFERAKYFPLINEYLVYKLTHEFYTDITSFGMGGMYDFVRKDINGKLLQLLELTGDNFPKMENAAEKGALISKEIAGEWEIPYRFPVYLCGNDQCASASGSGLKNTGDITINFGSAMVLFSLAKNFPTDLGPNQIAGKYPISDYYFLLSHEPDFGIVIRDLKEKFFKETSYDRFFQTYVDHPEVEVKIPHLSVDGLEFGTIEEVDKFCAGIIKYYMVQLKGHIFGMAQKVNIDHIYLSGAMAKSTVWLHIINKEVGRTIIINNQENAGLVGALNIHLSKK